MSTLQEIKAAAAKLPPEERNDLATWLNEANDVEAVRLAALRRELQIGMDEIARGEVAPLDMEEIKRKARAQFEARLAS